VFDLSGEAHLVAVLGLSDKKLALPEVLRYRLEWRWYR